MHLMKEQYNIQYDLDERAILRNSLTQGNVGSILNSLGFQGAEVLLGPMKINAEGMSSYRFFQGLVEEMSTFLNAQFIKGWVT